jgi:cupin superfamily acireductone dioxygenase involved in methionine salvage
MQISLLDKAYAVGQPRNCSLSTDYYVSPDGTHIFCQNQNSTEGVLVSMTSNDFIGDVPEGFIHFDMYEARTFKS